MKKQFQSKSVPRGTRTIWRYLGALFILFTFAIGNVWADTFTASEMVVQNSGKTAVIGTTKNHVTVYSPGITSTSSQQIWKDGGTAKKENTVVISADASNSDLQNRSGSYIEIIADDGYTLGTTIGIRGGAKNSSAKIAPVVWWETTVSSTIDGGKLDLSLPENTITSSSDADLVVTIPSGMKIVRIYRKVRLDKTTHTKFQTSNYDDIGGGSAAISSITATAVADCQAVAPGNISKGALNAGVLTLNADGTPAAKNVWYWQTSATGTSKDNSGTSFNVNAAGTYYVRSLYDNDCWSDAKSFTVTATDLVANYTVVYKDGTTELGNEVIAVGSHPEGIADPKKDCYTFAGWMNGTTPVADVTAISGTKDDVITLTASWTPNYASGAYVFQGTPVTTSKTAATIFNGALYFSAMDATLDTGDASYYGWKIKTNNATVKFLVQYASKVKITLKEKSALNVTFTPLEGAETTETASKSATKTILVKAGTMVTLTTTTDATTTLNRIEIAPLYTATRVDGKSDGAGSDANVLETTLPTPTAVSGWAFTGWTANEDVKDSEENTKTAGTVLAAGTYTLLANTTFTAQWTEASSTYDITYSSAHGTAPDAENAASVVLSELSADGWAHKGWTANVDVTVDSEPVAAGTLIANGKTVILASNVTFTAVWKEIFTVTFDAKGGSSVAPVDVEDGATLAAAPEDPTKDNYVFLGWSETDGGDVVADITAITISDDKTFYAKWKLDVQVSELVFSNSFKGWIHDGQVEVFYMAGESAPTIASYAGKNLKAEGGVVISGDKVIATGTDDSEKEYALTMTAVTPLTATGAQTFDGTEGYVKTRHAWTETRKWKMSKDGTDGRVARGETSMYIFLGAAESVTLDWGAQKVTNDVAVYVNGEFVKNIGKNNNSAIELSNGKNMVALYSLQTSGDIWLNGLTVAPWVPVTGVTLKEGEDPISSKEIWESTSFTLTAEVTPDNASNKTITWTSSNNDVATVVNGVVTGVAANATPVTITASTVDGVNATCVVTVTEAPSPCETPTINTQPASQAYCAGSEPTLSVDASVTDGGTLHYAWFKDDVAIGSDAATCVVTGAGTYKVVVTNKKEGKLDASVTSANAVVTLNAPASITTQPTDLKKQTEGANITLSVVAANATAYQWYSCDNKDKENPVLISGADEAEYEFAAAAGFFYCEVTGLCGNVESNVAQVTVKRSAGCQYITATSGYEATLADGLKLYACGSDGKTSTDGIFADATSDVTTVDANAVGEFNKQYIIMKFPVDVEEITLYGTNSSDRSINSVRVKSTIGSTSADKFTDDMIVATTKTATREGKDISMTAVMDEPISKDDYVFVNFNGGSMHVYRICYTEALPKPVLPTLSNQEYCAGGSFVAWNAETTVTEGTLSYQWYDADADEAIEGATNWAYTPTANGHYYVKVTNASAGRVSRVTQSSTLSAMIYDAMTITTAPEDVTTQAGVAASLSVEASGNSLSYAWYTCDANGDNAVALDPAVTTAELNVTAQLGVQYYKVVVTDDCDAELSAVAKVEGIATLPLVAINGSYTWDFTKASAAQIKLDGNTAVKKDEEAVMVNIPGVEVDQSKFKSQALKFSGEYIHRTDDGTKYPACATTIKFETTVPGKVTVVFADNGGNNRRLSINGNISEASTGKTDYKTYSAVVPAGEVVLTGYKDNAGGKYIRFFSIDFTAASELNPADADYTRDVTEGRYGTICLENGGVMVGATLYEVAYYGETSKKIFFDEILNGEMEAGVPYIYLPNENATQLGVFYTDAAGEDEQSANGLVGYIGESEATEHALPVPVGSYILNNNQYREVVYANSAYILSHRAYINLSAINPSEPALVPGRRRISMSVQSEQVVTGIDALNVGEQPIKVMINGQIFILRGEKMYDATGRLVK